MSVIRLLYALLITVSSFPALAQVSIGYLDLNTVLMQYPDMNQANNELANFEQKLSSDLQAFQRFLETQIQAYRAKQQAGISDAEKSKYEADLEKLNGELQERMTLAQQEMIRKRGELMSPALIGVDKALREIAEKKQLDCVVQRENEVGIPVVVFAPDHADLTVEVLKHLGWRLTDEQKTAVPFNVTAGNTSIGFTNVELVLANMPAIKAMETELATYQKKLVRDFETKQANQMNRFNDYKQKKDSGQTPAAELSRLEKELMKQDNELQQFPQFADALLQERRIELMEPALEVLQNAINKVAADNGFTFILNQTITTGVTAIVHGPQNSDITPLLYKTLNIPGAPAPTALAAPKNIKVGYLNVEKVFAGMPGVKEVSPALQKKLQDTINAIAAEKGYTYMLNKTSDSNILYMNPAQDETQNVLKKLKS